MSGMTRSDRLLALIDILRDRRLHRAEDLAQRLKVSVRSIYRDMDTLAASGIPIEGTRGLGYRARPEITLPPLNLGEDELQALHLGLAVVAEGGDEALSAAARTLSAKIDAVLPEDSASAPRGMGFATGAFADAARGFAHMPAVRSAIRARQKLRVTLDSPTGPMVRTLRPLQMEYWGRVWTCIAWSEEDADFLAFRVDQVTALMVLPGLFVDEAGKTLADYRAAFPND